MGHKFLFSIAIEISNKVYIGLTTDEFAKRPSKLNRNKILSFKERKQLVIEYLAQKNYDYFQIIPISTSIGFADKISATHIIVTDQTIKALQNINLLRAKNSLNPLIPVILPRAKKDKDTYFSSTLIRSNL